MANPHTQNTNEDRTPHFTIGDLRPGRELTPEEKLIRALDAKLSSCAGSVRHLVENELVSGPFVQTIESMCCRTINAQGSLETKSKFEERSAKEGRELFEKMSIIALAHARAMYAEAEDAIKDAFRGAAPHEPGASSSGTILDSVQLMRVFVEKIEGGIDPTDGQTLKDGMIAKILDESISQAVINQDRKNFAFLSDQSVKNDAVRADKWVSAVKNLPNSEWQKIEDCNVELDSSKRRGRSFTSIQSEMLHKTLVTGVTGLATAAAGIALSSGIGGGSLLFTGLAFGIFAWNAWKQHLLHVEANARMTTLYNNPLRHLVNPIDMDSGIAWSGVLFKVLRDYNPIPSFMSPDRTDFWRNTPDSKRDALLDKLRSAAAYGVERLEEDQKTSRLKDPQVEVARARKFGGVIKTMETELRAYQERWMYIPDVLNNVSVGTSVSSGILFAIDLLTKFR